MADYHQLNSARERYIEGDVNAPQVVREMNRLERLQQQLKEQDAELRDVENQLRGQISRAQIELDDVVRARETIAFALREREQAV